jgi:hypothetical protein
VTPKTIHTRNGIQRTVFDIVVHANEGLAVLDIMNRLKVLGTTVDRGHLNNLLKDLVDAGLLQRRLAAADELPLLNVPSGIAKMPFIYSPAGEDRRIANQRTKAARGSKMTTKRTQARDKNHEEVETVASEKVSDLLALIKSLEKENAELRGLVSSLAGLITKPGS